MLVKRTGKPTGSRSAIQYFNHLFDVERQCPSGDHFMRQ
jgi:hypothetical protein